LADAASRARDQFLSVVSHELRFAHSVATSVLMMDEGRIVEEAPPGEFFTSQDIQTAAKVCVLGRTVAAATRVVIADGGNEMQIIVTDPGTVITCIARRIFQVGDWRD